jgi:hypothetical protein
MTPEPRRLITVDGTPSVLSWRRIALTASVPSLSTSTRRLTPPCGPGGFAVSTGIGAGLIAVRVAVPPLAHAARAADPARPAAITAAADRRLVALPTMTPARHAAWLPRRPFRG